MHCLKFPAGIVLLYPFVIVQQEQLEMNVCGYAVFHQFFISVSQFSAKSVLPLFCLLRL
jgi:hypothetical protein